MNIFLDLFRVLVYEPQLNILYLIFKLTGGEIGISFIILAIVINLITLPIFIKSYINAQKNKVLSPKIQEIQQKYKKEPQLMLQKMREFNKKHNVDNSSFLTIILIQLFFVSGLFYLIKDVVDGNDISGLYQIFWGETIAKFKEGQDPLLAFGYMNIGDSASNHLWITILTLVFSYLYGMYTFRWAPKPKLPFKKTKKVNKDAEPPLFDPEQFQKSMEVQQIYFIPILIFIFNYSMPAGLNIYFATTSFLSLARQIFLTRFYANHTDELISKIIDSDPTSKDNNPDNNLENTALPSQIDDLSEVPTKIINYNSKKNKNIIKNQKKKNNKKLIKKITKK